MRRALIGLVMALATAASAQAVTVKDIVDLTKAGLGDEVLLALIEVDGGVFEVDASTLASLKSAGVSDKVIVALVRSGRARPLPVQPEPLAAPVAEQSMPPVVYVEQPPSTIVREVAVPFPVYVAIPGGSRAHRRADHGLGWQRSIGVPAAVHGSGGYITDTPPPSKHQEPVYWGSGGKLRPDAWQPAGASKK